MLLFSVSSFIDVLNAIVCAVLSARLYQSYQASKNLLVRSFALFYFIFTVFFFFLAIPFFMPSRPDLIQLSFVAAHFFLYAAMAVFIFLFIKLLKAERALSFLLWLTIALGAVISVLSWRDGGVARIFLFSDAYPTIVSWSHGGRELFRLVIGVGGMVLGMLSGIFLLYFSTRKIETPNLRTKGLILGLGLFMLGLASFLAFVLSIFRFYNFWIVLAAELTTISGLLVIYRAISRGWTSLQDESVI